MSESATAQERPVLPQEMQAPRGKPDQQAPVAKNGETPPATATITDPPIPEPKPAALGYAPAQPSPDKNPLATTVPPDLRAPQGKMPVDEIACRASLKQLGVEFQDAKPQISAGGCEMPYPVSLTSLGGGIEVKPEVTLNCQTALASAKFSAEVIQKAAQSEFKRPVKSIAQASGYVCRPRNGTRTLSEHAFGNALDIASFTLADGKVIEVKPTRAGSPEGKFLNGVRGAACGPFKTVLGPGSNADHEFHLHFDLAQRRKGGTYCK